MRGTGFYLITSTDIDKVLLAIPVKKGHYLYQILVSADCLLNSCSNHRLMWLTISAWLCVLFLKKKKRILFQLPNSSVHIRCNPWFGLNESSHYILRQLGTTSHAWLVFSAWHSLRRTQILCRDWDVCQNSALLESWRKVAAPAVKVPLGFPCNKVSIWARHPDSKTQLRSISLRICPWRSVNGLKGNIPLSRIILLLQVPGGIR